MTYKQINTSREIRQWAGIIVPVVSMFIAGGGVEKAKAAFNKIKKKSAKVNIDDYKDYRHV